MRQRRTDEEILEMTERLEGLIRKNHGLPIATRLRHYLDAINWDAGKSEHLITQDGMPKT